MTIAARPLQAGGRSVTLLKAGAAWGCEELSRYRYRVTARVARLMPRISVTDLYHSCLGAFPAVVKQSLLTLQAPEYRPQSAPAEGGTLSSDPAPWEDEELDIVDFQWFFDVRSAERILSYLPAGAGSLTALGTPTVAARAASRIRGVQLVDFSPRFEYGDHVPPWLDIEKIKVWRCDLDQSVASIAPADMVVMDPPWHLENYLAWLRTAVAVCKPGGLLAVALPQPLTNRRAEVEFGRLRKLLRRIGEVTVERGALSYVTPSFETPVLDADGLGSLRRWRLADLALVRVQHPAVTWDAPGNDKPAWKYRWLEGRVVRTWGEPATSDASVPVVRSADPAHPYRLRSVGQNYLWSSGINLVTSRGRAAVVKPWGRLPQILDLMAEGYAPAVAVKTALPGAPAGDRDELTATILTLLDR